MIHGGSGAGIGRVMKSLEPYAVKLHTDTWFYAKRCFLALSEALAKHMIVLKDATFHEILARLRPRHFPPLPSSFLPPAARAHSTASCFVAPHRFFLKRTPTTTEDFTAGIRNRADCRTLHPKTSFVFVQAFLNACDQHGKEIPTKFGMGVEEEVDLGPEGGGP